MIKELIGASIRDFSRACNLVCIEFVRRDGNKFSFHIQSFFRIVHNSTILVSSEDIYRCRSDCKAEEFEWDVPGKSIFDESLEKLLPFISDLSVVDVKSANCGDLIITFDDDTSLQVFVDTVESEEKYRILGNGESWVVCS